MRNPFASRIAALLIITVIITGAITACLSLSQSPTPSLTAPTATIDPLSMVPTRASGVSAIRPDPGSVCPYDPLIAPLAINLSQENWSHWIKILSGEKAAVIRGENTLIETRSTADLFNGNPNARAYAFLLEQLHRWGYEDGVTLFEESYHREQLPEQQTTWKNLIVVIPGSDPALADEQVLMTAHLDSINTLHPEENAPGADDNATGTATLLEAARMLRETTFRRTIKIIFFTGEEQGLLGSQAYTQSHANEMEQIVGVLNLDMFGYDADDDNCFEIHTGTLAASNQVGGCLADTIEIYDLDLTFDYLTDQAKSSSDHRSFWEAGVGAVEVLENLDTHYLAGGCGSTDFNPYYHSTGDVIEAMDLEMGHAIARAAIMAVAKLAIPMSK